MDGMNVKEFRRAHLLEAIEVCSSIAELARRSGVNDVYITQIKNGTRDMGHKTAKKIEAAMQWPPGTMDNPPNDFVDEEIIYLLKTLPEKQILQALQDSIPHLSEQGLRALTSAALHYLSERVAPEE